RPIEPLGERERQGIFKPAGRTYNVAAIQFEKLLAGLRSEEVVLHDQDTQPMQRAFWTFHCRTLVGPPPGRYIEFLAEPLVCNADRRTMVARSFARELSRIRSATSSCMTGDVGGFWWIVSALW